MKKDYSPGQGLQIHGNASFELTLNFNNHKIFKELQTSGCSEKLLLLSSLSPHTTWPQGWSWAGFIICVCSVTHLNLKPQGYQIKDSGFNTGGVIWPKLLFIKFWVAAGNLSYILVLWGTRYIVKDTNREYFYILHWIQLSWYCLAIHFFSFYFVETSLLFLFSCSQNFWTIFIRQKFLWAINSIKKIRQTEWRKYCFDRLSMRDILSKWLMF